RTPENSVGRRGRARAGGSMVLRHLPDRVLCRAASYDATSLSLSVAYARSKLGCKGLTAPIFRATGRGEVNLRAGGARGEDALQDRGARSPSGSDSHAIRPAVCRLRTLPGGEDGRSFF